MNAKSLLLGPDRPELLREETLADIFRDTVRNHGDKIALIFGDESLSYHELDAWSDQIAALLNEKGIGPGSHVGLWWPRGLALHTAILGIVKSGAAYVPLDKEMPAERVHVVLQEANAAACFAFEEQDFGCSLLKIPAASDTHIKPSFKPAPDNRAYILYTSGSTGKPKGIPISHRQICHLVRSEAAVLDITSEDRVYQGFSVSFDMWCEETWISYLAGATIYVAAPEEAKAIDELDQVLNKQQITVLHAVPSLLAVMDDDIPTLRLVNAGGEACTPQVLNRWAKDRIRFFNSYGPTETTVTATMAELKAGDTISIGLPLPNYQMAVVDEENNPVAYGVQGELVISGPGVGEGYINNPTQTAEKFVPKPASLSELSGEKIYKTGDAAAIFEDGRVIFHGRLDDQIKLRGYRIELGEIENTLNAIAGVTQAAVVVKKDNNGQEQLVGYVQIAESIELKPATLREELMLTLPSYMIPAVIVALAEFPRLPSGKINRKALPIPEELTALSSFDESVVIDPNAPVSERILSALQQVFPHRKIETTDDFFNDLGGHSLLAATFVSKLRKEGNLKHISLKDIYLFRPISKLIEEWSKAATTETKTGSSFQKIPALRYYLCWLAQSLALILIYGLFAAQIFFPYLGYYYVQTEGYNHLYSIIAALCLFCFIPPVYTFFGIAVKWMVLGKVKEGDYPLWGWFYFRWWFTKTVQSLVPIQFLNNTPLFPSYLRMMGVKIAADAQVGSIQIGAEDLVTIGSDVSLSSAVLLNNAVVEDGLLKLRSIHIGDHAYIGSSAVIAGGATAEEWGELQDLSHLGEGKTIKKGEIWKGSPAMLHDRMDESEYPQPDSISANKRFTYQAIFFFLLFVFPFAVLIPIMPVIVALNELDKAAADYDFSYIITTPMLALLYILLFLFQTIFFTRALQWNIKPGKYSIYSLFYIRKWLADQLMELSLIVLHPIYATVFVRPMFRALGAKVGKHTEISTANNVTHPLLEIGHDAFVADAVTLGESDVRGQRLILDRTSIADNSFVGNSALIPQGYHVPSNMLIGVLSVPPAAEQLEGAPGQDWFGSPAIALPRRQQSRSFPESLTSRPSMLRRLARGTIEFIRIIIPETVILSGSILFISYGHDLLEDNPVWQIILYYPFYYLAMIGIPAFVITLLCKWFLIGIYKQEQVPLWTTKVWRSEAVTSMFEALSVPFLLEFMKGTPWLPLLMRLMGAKTGKRVWMQTADITEFDMVSIGDDAALNRDSGPQTHLFEDRVMKIGPVKIGARTSIGAKSIVLYDSEIGDDVKLSALSLIMKGEQLQDGTSWEGSPVRPKQG
jgi:non-ribosomal peptide synthetase-like protein